MKRRNFLIAAGTVLSGVVDFMPPGPVVAEAWAASSVPEAPAIAAFSAEEYMWIGGPWFCIPVPLSLLSAPVGAQPQGVEHENPEIPR